MKGIGNRIGQPGKRRSDHQSPCESGQEGAEGGTMRVSGEVGE